MMSTKPEVSREEIKEFAAADPSLSAGLLNYEVVEWHVAMNRSV